MASKVQQEKPLESMMRNLKVDTSSEVGKNNKAAPRAGNPADATAFGPRPGVVMNGGKGDAGKDYLAPEQGNCYPMNGYYGYYYPGFDGSYAENDEQGYHFGPEGLEIQYPVVQGDNGQLLYYTPGYHFGYDAYGSFMPGAMVGIDGQYMTQQPFFPGAVVQQPLSPQVFSPSPVAYGADMFPAYTWETSPLAVDASSGNGLAGGMPVSVPKSNLPSSVHTLAAAKTAAPLKTNNSVNKDTKQLVDVPSNQPNKAVDKISQQASTLPASTALAKGYFPIAKFPEKTGLHYAGGNTNAKAGGQTWISPEKLKGRNRVNGLTGFDWLNEQNRGPRTTGPKNPVTSHGDSAGLDGNANNAASVIRSDQFNLPDFQTKYDHAMFYVIKSYSEDDVHKSIKYSVWASTPNGNKRLDNAYEEAQKEVEEKGSKCPVFLFFSVNASGQFCGVAEMTGRVDFDKSMDFWQQDKWTGFFPVKWHIIKDVPNIQFRHIILENNDNKPVTNSRDTQEVKFFQGIEMLNIFKNYSAKTSIIDDFGFYESRQKIMQDKKIRPAAIYPEHFQKKSGDVLQLPQVGDIKNDSSSPADNLTTVKKDPELKLASIKRDADLNGAVKE